jgi:hypothetical protein
MMPGFHNFVLGIYVVCFSLKSDIEEAPENLQMELQILQCDTNLNQVICERRFQDFYCYLPKEKFPLLKYCGLRMIVIFGSTCV